MSNSSPTALERIRRAAQSEAYINARRLGYHAVEAYREAETIAKFIDRTMAVEPTTPREIYTDLLRRFCDDL